MTRFSFVPVLLLLSCCSPGHTFEVKADFNDEYLAIMEQEAEILCAATDGDFCALFNRDEEEDNEVRLIDLPNPALGKVYVDTTLLLIKIDPIAMTEKELFRKVFRHELGHTGECHEGNKHLPPGNVMSTDIAFQPNDWTAADIDCVKNGF